MYKLRIKVDEEHPLHGMSRLSVLLRIFVHWFKLSLFVVGGGYAIILAAENLFEHRLKWLKKGELMKMLPVFQTIPGLIAGNSAMYTGWRIAGAVGAVVALCGVVLPSFIIILLIAHGYTWLPTENAYVQGAFLGVRCALTGIVVATIIKAWKNVMHGQYAYLALPIYCMAIIIFKVSAAYVLIGSILFGILYMAVVMPLYNRYFKAGNT